MELLTVRVLNLQTQCMLGNISTWPCVQQVVKRDVRMKVFIEFYTESPGPPSDLSLSNVTNTSALLSWPPPNYGGGRPLSEIFYNVTATGECGSTLSLILLVYILAFILLDLSKHSI